MKIYITRHGQVINWGIGGDVQFPEGDPPLSQLGRQQASGLGAYLKHLGFSGKIYSSPFARALETAEAIADQTGSLIVPWAPVREIVKTKESTARLVGMTLEQIRERYNHIDPEATLPYPWWGLVPESPEDVTNRVRAGIETLDKNEDALLVGHGASVHWGCVALQIPYDEKGNGYNCSFNLYDSENPQNCVYMRGDHLPYDQRTFNAIWQKKEEEKLTEEFLAQGLQIPEAVSTATGKKLLLLGNTRSVHYPYIRQVIHTVKPQIIVHAGNFVNEVKAGSIPNTQAEYTCGLMQLAEILKQSGAETIYAAPGENDISQVLTQHLDFAQKWDSSILSLPSIPEESETYAAVMLLPEESVWELNAPPCYHWNKG